MPKVPGLALVVSHVCQQSALVLKVTNHLENGGESFRWYL